MHRNLLQIIYRIIIAILLNFPLIIPYGAYAAMYEVADITDGGTLLLGNGKQIKPACIRPDKAKLPDLVNFLTGAVKNRTIDVKTIGIKNRYGEEGAIISRGETDFGQLLVSIGLARADPWGRCDDVTWRKLNAADMHARAEIKADNAADFIAQYSCITGKTKSVTQRSPFTYINFGDDWRSDFTIRMRNKTRRAMAQKSSDDPLNWAGRNVRVCGVVQWNFGPQIDLSSIRQITFLP